MQVVPPELGHTLCWPNPMLPSGKGLFLIQETERMISDPAGANVGMARAESYTQAAVVIHEFERTEWETGKQALAESERDDLRWTQMYEGPRVEQQIVSWRWETTPVHPQCRSLYVSLLQVLRMEWGLVGPSEWHRQRRCASSLVPYPGARGSSC